MDGSEGVAVIESGEVKDSHAKVRLAGAWQRVTLLAAGSGSVGGPQCSELGWGLKLYFGRGRFAT